MRVFPAAALLSLLLAGALASFCPPTTSYSLEAIELSSTYHLPENDESLTTYFRKVHFSFLCDDAHGAYTTYVRERLTGPDESHITEAWSFCVGNMSVCKIYSIFGSQDPNEPCRLFLKGSSTNNSLTFSGYQKLTPVANGDGVQITPYSSASTEIDKGTSSSLRTVSTIFVDPQSKIVKSSVVTLEEPAMVFTANSDVTAFGPLDKNDFVLPARCNQAIAAERADKRSRHVLRF